MLSWFAAFVNPLLTTVYSTREYRGSPTEPLANSTIKRKPDVFLCESGVAEPDWSNVLVVGQLKQSSNDTLTPTLIAELANYVQLIFQKQ